jgi:co-chaperonin GroES (HSP10)
VNFLNTPHKVNKDKLIPIKEHILVSDMKFDERITRGGIVLLNDDMKSHGIRPRWAKIYKLGPSYEGELKEGQYILIAHGRWTRGITIEDEEGKQTLRRVDPNDILLVSDHPVDDETISDKGL